MGNRVKRGDTVLVIAGKEKSKKGKVLKVFPKERRVIVEGLNFVKRNTKPSQKNQKGGIIEKEGSLHFSNVMLYCANCQKGARVGYKILEDNTKSRYCKHCGEGFR